MNATEQPKNEQKQNSLIPILEESNRLIVEAIKHFGLKVSAENIVITVQSAGRSNALGWYWHGRWSNGKPAVTQDEEGNCRGVARAMLHEINLCAEHLKSHDMGGTLIHGLAHAENDFLNIQDCSGRRHNKKFKSMAERLGLKVEAGKSVGYGYTDLDEGAKSFLCKINFDRRPFQMSRLGEGDAKKKKGPGSRLVKVECPDCGYVVRTTQKWIDNGLPTCACGQEMEVAA